MENTELMKQEALQEIMNIEFVPAIKDDLNQINNYTRFPVTSIASLGAMFSSLPGMLSSAASSSGSGEQLYRLIMPDSSGVLAAAKGKSGTYGNIVDPITKKFTGRARFEEVATTVKESSKIAIDPAMMCMAVAMMSIDKKLNDIQKTQEEIVDYLVLKDRAEQKGDLETLSQIMNSCKYNCGNENYKKSNSILVQNIKRSANQKIEFYSEQIKKELSKSNLIFTDKKVKEKLNKLLTDFKDYQLSVYLYSFSSFIDVLLVGNFNEGYLSNVVSNIEDCSYKYRELYTECYNQIEAYSQSSVNSYMLKGLSKASGFAGKLVEKTSVISKTQLDENLAELSNKLSSFDEKLTDNNMTQFINNTNYVRPFVENIETISKIYNQPNVILFDKDNIYIEATV